MATISSAEFGIDHIGHLVEVTCQRFPYRPALRWLDETDSWVLITWSEVLSQVRQLGRALIAAGVERGDRVAIFSHNVAQWLLCDWAVLGVGGVTVTVYSTSTPDQVGHIVADSEASVIFVESESEASRVEAVADRLPQLRQMVVFHPGGQSRPGRTERSRRSSGKGKRSPLTVVSYDDFFASGGAVDTQPELEQRRADRFAELDPDDLNAIIYTSGTTGDPKGVALSHRAMVSQMYALDEKLSIDVTDTSLCFLPLAHALERGWSTYVMLHGCMNTLLPNPRNIAEMMVRARPSMLVSVPKLFETIYRVAHEKVSGSKAKSAIFNWALRVGDKAQRHYRAGERPSWWLRTQLRVADRLVLHSIRDAVGGTKSIFVCGGAAMRREIEEFFAAAGLPVLNGYGMTEAAPLISFNSPECFKVGTVGKVLPGGQLRISEAGEVLYRGPNVMDGYWRNPEATAETIVDGWLHTGDIGEVDDDGFLTITDRLKDIIVTSGGKNVAPQPIEGMILADPFFEQAVVLGDDRPFLTMLMKPSMPKMNELAESLQLSFENLTDLYENQEILAWIKERISTLTEKLPSQEQIRDIRILPEGFSLENGLLTPSLKVKRREVEKQFKNLIDEMYEKVGQSRKAALRAAKAVQDVFVSATQDESTEGDPARSE